MHAWMTAELVDYSISSSKRRFKWRFVSSIQSFMTPINSVRDFETYIAQALVVDAAFNIDNWTNQGDRSSITTVPLITGFKNNLDGKG